MLSDKRSALCDTAIKSWTGVETSSDVLLSVHDVATEPYTEHAYPKLSLVTLTAMPAC